MFKHQRVPEKNAFPSESTFDNRYETVPEPICIRDTSTTLGDLGVYIIYFRTVYVCIYIYINRYNMHTCFSPSHPGCSMSPSPPATPDHFFVVVASRRNAFADPSMELICSVAQGIVVSPCLPAVGLDPHGTVEVDIVKGERIVGGAGRSERQSCL